MGYFYFGNVDILICLFYLDHLVLYLVLVISLDAIFYFFLFLILQLNNCFYINVVCLKFYQPNVFIFSHFTWSNLLVLIVFI